MIDSPFCRLLQLKLFATI